MGDEHVPASVTATLCAYPAAIILTLRLDKASTNLGSSKLETPSPCPRAPSSLRPQVYRRLFAKHF